MKDQGSLSVVTGGSGFFGRALVRRLLAEGERVRVLDVAGHPDLDARAELVQADLRDRRAVGEAVAGAAVVFHTAALINLSGVASAGARRTVHEVNVGGTRNLLDACREHGVSRVVYTSTNNVVFDREIINGDETEPYARRAFDLYTLSKTESERLVLAAADGASLRTCALRPGGIWAPYAGGVMIDKVLEQIARGSFVARIGQGSVADNTHVDNLAEAQWLAARALSERPELVSGQAYFITDGEPMDTVEWFRPLVEALGEKMPERRVPGPVMYALAYVLEWVHRFGGPKPLITRLEVLKVTRTHSFRIDKARAHLGYEPKIKSAQGLLECVPYAREFLTRRGRIAHQPAE